MKKEKHSIYLKAFKYANVYLSIVFAGFILGMLNTVFGASFVFLVAASYLIFVLPIMVFAKLFLSMGLMLQAPDGTLFPSDAAMILGHIIWYIFFYALYLTHLLYKRHLSTHRQLTKFDE